MTRPPTPGQSLSPTSAVLGHLKVHRVMADTIPGARHVVISGVGHLTNLEAPDAFNRAVTRFLREAALPTRAMPRPPRSGAQRSRR